MNRFSGTLVFTILATGLVLAAWAADVAGQWKATIDTQIGEQHSADTCRADGEKLTGTAKNDRGTMDINNATIEGDRIGFDESLDFNGQTIPIKYTRTVSGAPIRLHCKVGPLAEEDVVANREK